MNNVSISASMEDYLEAIFLLVREKDAARPKEIAEALGVKAPSVTKALRWLGEHGLIHYAPFEQVTLTESGEKTARQVLRRHEALRRFFEQVLSIDPDTADESACRMEHAMGPEVLERLTLYIESVSNCPAGLREWVEGVGYRCDRKRAAEACRLCAREGR